MAELERSAARGALWLAIETWAAQLLGLATYTLLARQLGPETFGIMGLALVPALALQLPLLYGGWLEALVQRRVLTPLHRHSVFWFTLGAGLLIAALLAVVSPWLARWLGVPEAAAAIAVLGLTVPLTAHTLVP